METVETVETGIPGLNELIGGGIPEGRVILLVGGPGSGKTIFCSQFLWKGISDLEESAIFVSLDESKRIAIILSNHTILDKFSGEILAEDRRGIYSYFKDTGPAGLDLAFLRLAQVLSESGSNLPNESWEQWLSIFRVLCHAWFEKHEEWIQPNRILSGDDLQYLLGIAPGPDLGKVLGVLEESQAAGEINTRGEAESFVINWYNSRVYKLDY